MYKIYLQAILPIVTHLMVSIVSPSTSVYVRMYVSRPTVLPPSLSPTVKHTPQLPFGVDTPQRAVSQPLDREAILSLYSSNPSHNGGLPNVAYHHGYPYHQQQMAVLHAQQQVYYSQMQNQVCCGVCVVWCVVCGVVWCVVCGLCVWCVECVVCVC